VEKSKKKREIAWVDVGDEDEEEQRRLALAAKRRKLLQNAARTKGERKTSISNGTHFTNTKPQNQVRPETLSSATMNGTSHSDDLHQPNGPVEQHSSANDETFTEEPLDYFDTIPNNQPHQPSTKVAALTNGHILPNRKHKTIEEQVLEAAERREEQEVAEAITAASPTKRKRKNHHPGVNGMDQSSVSDEEATPNSHALSPAPKPPSKMARSQLSPSIGTYSALV
jgi:hypothetical protein